MIDNYILCPRCLELSKWTPDIKCCWCSSTRLVPSNIKYPLPVWERLECKCDVCIVLKNERILLQVPEPTELFSLTPEIVKNKNGRPRFRNRKGFWVYQDVA